MKGPVRNWGVFNLENESIRKLCGELPRERSYVTPMISQDASQFNADCSILQLVTRHSSV